MNSKFELVVNGINDKLKIFVFAGGEVSVKVLNHVMGSGSHIELKAHIVDSDGILAMMMAVDAIRREYNPKFLGLTLPYLPYARQDRVCNRGEALSVKVMCDIINSLGFDRVTIDDCHSDVGPALLNNCINTTVWDIIKHTEIVDILCRKDVVLISPDAGSNKKIFTLAKHLYENRGVRVDVIRADKTRDTSTGQILETVVYCDDLTGKTAFIVDDICEGGRTFIELTKALKNKNAHSVSLYVTHGLFTKGLLPLYESGIDNIYTANSWIDCDIQQFIKLK